MGRIICFALLTLSMASCYRTASEPEFDKLMVLPPDTMVIILCDLHIADGVINTIKSTEQPVGQLSTEYFDAILRNHSITREVFEESMRYYAYHAEDLDKIYEKVITELSKKESLARPDSKVEEKPAE